MDTNLRKYKRRKISEYGKFLVGEKVEVLSCEDDIIESWHAGLVIGIEKCGRLIQFSHSFAENCSRVVESIELMDDEKSLPIVNSNKHHGRIRPFPPQINTHISDIKYGSCVDALLHCSWQEGVIFDRDEGSTERSVFFPDSCSQQRIAIARLRPTQDWDEFYGCWKPRGEWLFLQVLENFEQDDALPFSAREIWCQLKGKESFMEKIDFWASGSQPLWHSLVSDLMKNLPSSVVHGLQITAMAPGSLIVPPVSNKLEVVNPDFVILEDSHLMDEVWKILENDGDSQNTITCSATDIDWVDNSAESLQNSTYGKLCWKPIELEAQGKGLRGDGHNKIEVKKKMRQHLLDMGWRIEYKIDKMKRLRYISPEGKTFYSLEKVRDFINGINCPIPQMELEPNPRKRNVLSMEDCKLSIVHEEVSANERLEPECLPNAIREYEEYMELKKRKENEPLNADIRSLRLNAKKHLLHMGWKLWMKEKGTKQELRYTSPMGRTYISLSTACRSILEAEGLDTTCHNSLKPTNRSKKNDGILTTEKIEDSLEKETNCRNEGAIIENPFPYFPKSVEVGGGRLCLRRFRKPNKGKKNTSVPNSTSRLSKLVQRAGGLSSGQHVAKSVLNWLINNNVVLERDTIYCNNNRNKHAMKEGKLTRAGIKCKCCGEVFSLSKFAAHAGSSTNRPAANIFLKDGRSLLQCQMEILAVNRPTGSPQIRLKSDRLLYESDIICSVCHDGGSLILCDNCPSSFHPGCVGLEAVPEENWYCPVCRCATCDLSGFNLDMEELSEKSVLCCDQCERKYHVGCLEKKVSSPRRNLTGNWFCNTNCSKIFSYLQGLLGKSNPTSVEGLSWTLLRWRRNGVGIDEFDAETMSEYNSKLCVALDLYHECFMKIIEPRTQSDLVADILFNKESELKRISFGGFYTMLLEKDDELISVATFRVYGEKVAEMPLVGTCSRYRKMGMCRLLMDELQKLLSRLGLERLLLPAIPEMRETWTKSFGFREMDSSELLQLSHYTFLNFQDTTVCQKVLKASTTVLKESSGIHEERIKAENASNITIDNHNAASEALEPISEPPSLGLQPQTLTATSRSNSEIHCRAGGFQSLLTSVQLDKACS